MHKCLINVLSVSTYLQDAREHGFLAFVRLPLTLALFDVLCELVEQVIDDLGSEDLDQVLFGKLLSIRHDLHIERQQTGVLLVGALVRRSRVLHSLEHVLLVDRANVDSADWDLTGVEELQQGLE